MGLVSRSSVAAPSPVDLAGAERILHRDSWWNVLLAEQQHTQGRVRASLRVAVALTIALLLTALVGHIEFVLCPITALTELQPGISHTPSLLLKRIGVAIVVGVCSVALVAAFPQNAPVLFAAILGVLWCLLYAAKILPVGSSGLLVALWAISPLLAKPLTDPTGFDLSIVYSTSGVVMGAVIAYLCAVFVFPGVETQRARVAADGLLIESETRLRAIAEACALDPASPRARAALEDSMSSAVLAHIDILTRAVSTYANEHSNFPELVSITRLASLSDSAALHLGALARESDDASVRASIAEIACALAQFFENARSVTLAKHWRRDGATSPPLDALVLQAESILALGDAILAREGVATNDALASVAGFAYRVGNSVRAALTERPLPAKFGEASLALPLGFPPASPLGNGATLASMFQRFDSGVALTALASVVGVAFTLIATTVFIPLATSPAALGAMAVLQSTLGATGRRGLLRLVGTAIGACLTVVAVTIFAGGVQDIGGYLLVMFALAFISAWVMVGSPRTSYAGFMMGTAFINGIAFDSAPPTTVQLVVDRVLSVLVACVCVGAVLMVVRQQTSRSSVMKSMENGWTLIADLMRNSQLHAFTEHDLTAFRASNQRALLNLAATADLREQHAFEHRLRVETFLPMLTMLAEQQRMLLLVRSLASGRFHEPCVPREMSAMLDAPLCALAARVDAFAQYFRVEDVVSDAVSCVIPSASQLRACAVAHGIDEATVARVLYRREVLRLVEQTAARARSNAQRGFIWKDHTLYCAVEVTDSGRTIAEVVGTLSLSTPSSTA